MILSLETIQLERERQTPTLVSSPTPQSPSCPVRWSRILGSPFGSDLSRFRGHRPGPHRCCLLRHYHPWTHRSRPAESAPPSSSSVASTRLAELTRSRSRFVRSHVAADGERCLLIADIIEVVCSRILTRSSKSAGSANESFTVSIEVRLHDFKLPHLVIEGQPDLADGIPASRSSEFAIKSTISSRKESIPGTGSTVVGGSPTWPSRPNGLTLEDDIHEVGPTVVPVARNLAPTSDPSSSPDLQVQLRMAVRSMLATGVVHTTSRLPTVQASTKRVGTRSSSD